MKVWIDQSLCNGNGVCVDIAPEAFVLLDDGLTYVQQEGTIFAASYGQPEGEAGKAEVPVGLADAVLEAAEECPLECIFVEP